MYACVNKFKLMDNNFIMIQSQINTLSKCIDKVKGFDIYIFIYIYIYRNH